MDDATQTSIAVSSCSSLVESEDSHEEKERRDEQTENTHSWIDAKWSQCWNNLYNIQILLKWCELITRKMASVSEIHNLPIVLLDFKLEFGHFLAKKLVV